MSGWVCVRVEEAETRNPTRAICVSLSSCPFVSVMLPVRTMLACASIGTVLLRVIQVYFDHHKVAVSIIAVDGADEFSQRSILRCRGAASSINKFYIPMLKEHFFPW